MALPPVNHIEPASIWPWFGAGASWIAVAVLGAVGKAKIKKVEKHGERLASVEIENAQTEVKLDGIQKDVGEIKADLKKIDRNLDAGREQFKEVAVDLATINANLAHLAGKGGS